AKRPVTSRASRPASTATSRSPMRSRSSVASSSRLRSAPTALTAAAALISAQAPASRASTGDAATKPAVPSASPARPGTMPMRTRRSIPLTIGYCDGRIKRSDASLLLAGASRSGQVADVGHDARELEILRRVDGRHAQALELGPVVGRDDAADPHRRLDAGLLQEAQ